MSNKKKLSTGVSEAKGYVTIDIHQIRDNTYQSRGHGVIPGLNKQGFGLFRKMEGQDGNEPIMSMLLSDNAEIRTKAVGLIDEHEPDIKELASSIATTGQLHNIGVQRMKTEDGKPTDFWDVVYGMRRTIARAYNHARSGGEIPAIVFAKEAEDIVDPVDLHFQALAENRGRRDESPMDECRRFMFLKKQGLKTKQIAEKMGENEQNVRNRLQLARLTQDEQERVHKGTLGMVNALKALKERENGTGTGEASNIPETRHRLPTYKQALTLLVTTAKPEDVKDDEWTLLQTDDVRRYLSLLCDVPFQTYTAMHAEQTAKADAEAKVAADEQAKKDAEKKAKEEQKAKEKAEAAAKKEADKKAKDEAKAKDKAEKEAAKKLAEEEAAAKKLQEAAAAPENVAAK
jgi:ParB/RepB/Spo0J family partition protein